MKRLILLFSLLPMLVHATAATTFYEDGFQIYGHIDEAEDTRGITCPNGNGTVAIDDGLTSGTWNGGTAILQYAHPISGWVQVSSTSIWTADTGAVPWDTGAGVLVRINFDTASALLGYWIICGE